MDDWEVRWAPYDEATYAAAVVAIAPDDVVLDIGAGDLRLTRRLAAVARRVIAWEIQPELLASGRLAGPWPAALEVVCADARRQPVPPGVTVAVLLMRHCAHFGLYVDKLRAAGCGRLITNARWRSGVEVIDLGPGVPYAEVGTGWYACRRCGNVGFAGDDPAQVTQATLDRVVDVEGCVDCQLSIDN